MKKIIKNLLFFTFFPLILSGCGVSYGGDGGEVIINITSLPSPSSVRVESDNYVYWDEVPNASSYIVKINGYQESAGNSLKYSISSIIDSKIEYDVPTDLHIYVKAKGNQVLYSDSDWSSEVVTTYTKKSNSNENGNSNGNSGNNGGQTTKTKLSTPTGVDYLDGVIVWNEVENSSYYVVEITPSNQEAFTVNRSTNYYELSFDESTSFKYRVKAIADEDSDYLDSNWSPLLDGNYSIGVDASYYNSFYKEKGLGMAINLFNDDASYSDVDTSKVSIFNPEKLTKLTVSKRHIAKGEVFPSISNSFEEKIDNYNHEISAKFSLAKIKPGQTKVVSQKKYGLDISYKNEYVKKSKSQTSVYLRDLQSTWQVDEYYFDGYASKTMFTNALSSSFLSDASNLQSNYSESLANQFINTYGTHIMTSSIWGATIEMHYSLIGTSEAIEEQKRNKASVEAMLSVNRWEASLATDLDFNKEDFTSNKDLNVNMSIKFSGGTNQAIGFSEENITGFNEFYAEWAQSTNEERNLALVDVGANSLHCIWDLLPDSYSDLKDKLDEYLLEKASQNYYSIMNKINNFYDEDYDGKIHITSDNVENFYNTLSNEDNWDTEIVLDTDITIPDDYRWTPIQSFGGKFDGNGHIISNFKINKNVGDSLSTNSYMSLFAVVESGASITNLGINNCRLTVPSYNGNEGNGELYVSALAGINYGDISNITLNNVYISVERNKTTIGSVVGLLNGGTVRNCRCNGLFMFSNGDQGGIVGNARNEAVINSCHVSRYNDSNSTIWYYATSSKSAGGIVGYLNGSTLSNCYIDYTDFSLRGGGDKNPKMGYIVGHMNNSTLVSVGMGSCTKESLSSTGNYYFTAGWGWGGYLSGSNHIE